MARDESRDVWLMRFGLDQALEAKEPRTVRLLPESNREYERIGYARYVPHEQLEAMYQCGHRDAVVELGPIVARVSNQRDDALKELEAAQKRVAELERRLATYPPRCKDVRTTRG